MYLEALATASPPFVFSQADCLAALSGTEVFQSLQPRSRALLGKVLGNGVSGIEERRFCLPEIGPVVSRSAQELNQAFEREAPKLAAQAVRSALEKAGIDAGGLDALLVCTCTGYLCPGLSSHMGEALGIRPSAYLQDLGGQGCGAAIPLLRAAQGFLAAHPGTKVATVAVEVCSAAFFADDDPGVLISLCLFGDGAAAAIWSDVPGPGKWRAGHFMTVHHPREREKIRFVNVAGKLRNQLDKSVPGLAAGAVKGLYERRSAEPQRILAHTGGRDVIDALESVLPHRLEDTREVLRRFGNMSSPSVLFALDRALQDDRGETRWWLTAFGAGFAAHACELWREP